MTITGVVTTRHEAMLRLVMLGVYENEARREEEIEALLDTGFTEHLVLPQDIVSRLGLALQGVEEAVLADGSRVALDVYRARVLWDAEIRDVQILASGEGDALVGMSLLHGHEVRLDVVEGGSVVIERLSRSRLIR